MDLKSIHPPARPFWADYAYLGAAAEELESGGTDWIHMKMRDGDHMGFQAPRSGLDILTGIPTPRRGCVRRSRHSGDNIQRLKQRKTGMFLVLK